MRTAGIYCLIFGVGSLVLPLVGLQFRLLSLFGAATPVVAVGLIVVGGVLLVAGPKEAAS